MDDLGPRGMKRKVPEAGSTVIIVDDDDGDDGDRYRDMPELLDQADDDDDKASAHPAAGGEAHPQQKRGVQAFARDDLSGLDPSLRWPYNAFGTMAAGTLDPRIIHNKKHGVAKEVARNTGEGFIAYDVNATEAKSYVCMAFDTFYEIKFNRTRVTGKASELLAPIRGRDEPGLDHVPIDHAYEALLIERPVKPYLDLEFDIKFNPDLVDKVDEMTRLVIEMVTTYLRKCFPENPLVHEITESDWIILDASNEKKVSRHAVLCKTGLYFNTLLDHGRFMSIVLNDFKLHVQPENPDPAYFALTVVREVGRRVRNPDGSSVLTVSLQRVPFADPSPYKEFQLWRTPGSTKYRVINGELCKRVLLPAAMNRFHVPAYRAGSTKLTREFVLACMVSAVEPVHVRKPPLVKGGPPVIELAGKGLEVDESGDLYLYGYSTAAGSAPVDVVLYQIGESVITATAADGRTSLLEGGGAAASGGGKRRKKGGGTAAGGRGKAVDEDEDRDDPIEEFGPDEERPIPVSNGFARALTAMPGWGKSAYAKPVTLSRAAPVPVDFDIMNKPDFERKLALLVEFVGNTPELSRWRANTTDFRLKAKAIPGNIEPQFYMLISNSKTCPIKEGEHEGSAPRTYAIVTKYGSVKVKCHAEACQNDPLMAEERLSLADREVLWPSLREHREAMERELNEQYNGGFGDRASEEPLSMMDLVNQGATAARQQQQQQGEGSSSDSPILL